MRLLAIFCPPVAVLLCGKPFQAIINLLLCFCIVLPGVIHAWGIVSDYKADKRTNRIVRATRRN